MVNEKQTILSVQQVKKKIGDKWIIKGVSFDIYEGEIFGFLGPNGSGKTTTIRMLVNLIRPTEGTIQICGKNVQTDFEDAMQYIGSIVENPEMYSYMTGWENLEHFARMMPGVHTERIQEVVEIVGLDQRIHDKVKTYSLGMRQRLGIAQALLGKPKLLILDEPTNGLDPQGIKELRIFIRKLADEGMSLFISSHLLSEIQLMCDRVAIISHGEVIKVGHVKDLVNESNGVVRWKVSDAETAKQILTLVEEVTVLDSTHYTELLSIPTSDNLVLTQSPNELIPIINRKLLESGIEVYGILQHNPTLEELFLKITEGEAIE